jgi:hypothetical protein
MDFDWKAIVKTVAPGIASVFGTPLAGVAVKAVADAILPSDSPKTEEAIAAALQTQPELALKLKQADLEFKKSMAEAGIKLEEIAAQDRANARAREIATADYMPKLLAGVFTVGWFGIQWYLLAHVIPQEMREIIMRTLGTLDMTLGAIIYYYYGSSAGSDRKTEMLRKA